MNFVNILWEQQLYWTFIDTLTFAAEMMNQKDPAANVLMVICHLSDPGLLSENWQIGQQPAYTCLHGCRSDMFTVKKYTLFL